MAPGVAVVLGGSLVLRGSRRSPGVSCGRRGGCCGRYRPLRLSWRSTEGSAGVGLARVKVRTPPEGCAHAHRGFRSRGGYGELAVKWQEQCQARPHRVSQVPTGLEQYREWRNSDRSWQTGLRSQHAVWHGRLMPPDPCSAVEWLAFNASVRWAGELMGC